MMDVLDEILGSTFYSLVGKDLREDTPSKIDKRVCLRCTEVFNSPHEGVRICSQCKGKRNLRFS